MGSPTNVKSQCGTLLYMAPQILHQPSYSRAVDIWSCAVIMYILYTGKHPIYVESMKAQQFKQKLKTCCFPQLPSFLANNFIKNVSKIEYTQRYSANEALRHPWITRSQQDQIPLSANQSIHSFNTSHLISDCLKYVLTMQRYFPYKPEVPKQYMQKLKSFNQKHEQARVRSPSFKKMKRTNNQTIMKMNNILILKQKQSQERKKTQYFDLQSPVIRKHEKLFLRLFQKNRQDSPVKFLNLESCESKIKSDERLQLSNNLQLATLQLKPHESNVQQIYSPISISCHSMSSARNTAPIAFYDVQLPLIRITNQKKDKSSSRIRKLNSLRQGSVNKNQSNSAFFRGQTIKNSEQKLRDTFATSKSKRVYNKQEPYSPQLLRSSGKKPQTADRGRTLSKNKDNKNMVFGLRVTHC